MTENSNTSTSTDTSLETLDSASTEVNFEKVNLRPLMDVFESEDALLIHTDMPGVQKEDLEVDLEGDTLVLKGTWRKESETKGSDTSGVEYTFKRDIRLNRQVDVDGVSATLQDGLLSLALPWAKSPEPRRISVN